MALPLIMVRSSEPGPAAQPSHSTLPHWLRARQFRASPVWPAHTGMPARTGAVRSIKVPPAAEPHCMCVAPTAAVVPELHTVRSTATNIMQAMRRAIVCIAMGLNTYDLIS